jgi:hypothetical protein
LKATFGTVLGLVSIAMVAAAAAPVVAHPGTGSMQAFACAINAPSQTACSTGLHSHNGGFALGFGGTFVGTASNIVEWDDGNGGIASASVTCAITGMSVPFLCTFAGTPPSSGVEFTHRCEVGPLSMVPPTGQLLCVVNHD